MDIIWRNVSLVQNSGDGTVYDTLFTIRSRTGLEFNLIREDFDGAVTGKWLSGFNAQTDSYHQNSICVEGNLIHFDSQDLGVYIRTDDLEKVIELVFLSLRLRDHIHEMKELHAKWFSSSDRAFILQVQDYMEWEEQFESHYVWFDMKKLPSAYWGLPF